MYFSYIMCSIKKSLLRQQPINQNSIIRKWKTLRILWVFIYVLWDCYLVRFFCEACSHRRILPNKTFCRYWRVLRGCHWDFCFISSRAGQFYISLKRQKNFVVFCICILSSTWWRAWSSLSSLFHLGKKRTKSELEVFLPSPSSCLLILVVLR